jgi:hypothetical protein
MSIEWMYLVALNCAPESAKMGWVWWHMPLIPALGRQRQVGFWVRGQPGLQNEFQDSQGYTEKPCLEENNNNNNKVLKWALCPQLILCHIPKYCQERAGLQGVPTHLWAQVRPPLLFKFLVQEGLFQSHQDKEQPGTGSFWFLSAPWSWPYTTALHTQIPPRENCLPRNTETQICRRNKSQREQEQLTPEITRYQEARSRT